MEFKVGDRVKLTAPMYHVSPIPKRLTKGTVVYVGSWKVCDVLFDGLDKPIMMRFAELELINEKGEEK